MMTQVRKPRSLSIRQAAARSGPVRDKFDTALFAALADPTRAALLACMVRCGRPCTVGEVASCCSVDLSVVSRHLRALKEAGVLESARDGRTVAYRVRAAEVCRTLRDLADAIETCCPSVGCEQGESCGC